MICSHWLGRWAFPSRSPLHGRTFPAQQSYRDDKYTGEKQSRTDNCLYLVASRHRAPVWTGNVEECVVEFFRIGTRQSRLRKCCAARLLVTCSGWRGFPSWADRRKDSGPSSFLRLTSGRSQTASCGRVGHACFRVPRLPEDTSEPLHRRPLILALNRFRRGLWWRL
jgi:hypothetical protein